ncbi:flavin reductase [Bradyrhizobium sp. CB82]|uniref:flavin reductase n=1 Tax=Bradyrhizobium sp. CB82 TaxID=3039159 RepID=UPI0024B1552A|nr:flavin reductase [Bradyrhizobium sp. CB82]WFU40009.1 flavin reductase [Bradyrhizobium sp. CB82]
MTDEITPAILEPSILSEGRADSDSRSFRTCLGQFGTGVTVMTSELNGRLAAVTAGSFSSLSLDPPLVLWSIGRSSRSATIFERATRFNVNVLAEDQISVSQHFASSAVDKFHNVQWFNGHNQCPVLPGIVALFECDKEIVYEGGDHLIIIGRVHRFVRYSGKPLLFVQTRYAIPQVHPELQSPPTSLTAAPKELKEMEKLSELLLEAARLRVGRFEKHRRAEGVNYLQSRALFALYARSNQAIPDLAQEILAAPGDCTDTVAELIERKLLTKDDSGKVSLTDAGREKRNAILRRSDVYEAECLSGFEKEQIGVVRGFLEEFIQRFTVADSTL